MHSVPKRLPVIPTIIVALAVAVMIGLGVWQLQRAEWKQDLLARLEANSDLPTTFVPMDPAVRKNVEIEEFFFRRARDVCLAPVTIRTTAGRNLQGTPGWSYVATCRASDPSRKGLVVDIGWSPRFDAAPRWIGGEVEGVIVPDEANVVRFVAADAAPGLEPSQPPGPDTIPNNHLFYAAQWFFFAAAAGVIYALALRKRWIRPQA